MAREISYGDILMTTKIVSIMDKFPDFVEYQHASIEKFVKGDFRHVVFNNAIDDNIKRNIGDVCRSLNIEVINLNLTQKSPKQYSQNHANALNFVWQNHISKWSDPVLWIDGDMFFVYDIDISAFSNNHDLAYCPIYRNDNQIQSMWTGIMFFNLGHISKDIDFNLGKIGKTRVDSGGMTHYYLEKHPEYRKGYFEIITLIDSHNARTETVLNLSRNIDIVENHFYTYNNKKQELLDENVARFFNHEKQDLNYLKKYTKLIDQCIRLAKAYRFPRPYLFDIVKMNNFGNIPFLIHYKSASWHTQYGGNSGAYATAKKNSIKNIVLRRTK